MVWVGKDPNVHPVPTPCLGLAATHQIRAQGPIQPSPQGWGITERLQKEMSWNHRIVESEGILKGHLLHPPLLVFLFPWNTVILLSLMSLPLWYLWDCN